MQPKGSRKSGRSSAIAHLHNALARLVRRRAELGGSMYSELSLVGYTFLSEITMDPGIRAADLATMFGLDKSTVSRQLNDLEAAGFLRREVEQPGRRGNSLIVSAKGAAVVERETARLRDLLIVNLAQWKVGEIATLAELVERFIADMR